MFGQESVELLRLKDNLVKKNGRRLNRLKAGHHFANKPMQVLSWRRNERLLKSPLGAAKSLGRTYRLIKFDCQGKVTFKLVRQKAQRGKAKIRESHRPHGSFHFGEKYAEHRWDCEL